MKAVNAIAVPVILAAAVVGWWVFERSQPAVQQAGSSYSKGTGGAQAKPALWTVDPGRPGPNLPPVGRSLFDFVVVVRRTGAAAEYDIPFPFDALVRRVEERAGCTAAQPCTRQVLIPLGRSLQRTAASPDFFDYPRVVVAVDREGGSGMLLKDRLYLGYQEKANLIEVISYNEAAARFEFQLVRDYRAGASPHVVYANRRVCTACHQNHAPLFSRQQWDETNANPGVAARLGAARRAFYGSPARRGIEVPNAIDDAIHRANLLAVTQFLWREGCPPNGTEGLRCRRAALIAALQYKLSGERGFDSLAGEFREAVIAAFEKNAGARWPNGLAIPNPEIPNRDPLALPEGASGVAMTHIAAPLEALLPRAPLETWTDGGAQTASRFVAGLAEFLSDSDARLLDEHLTRSADGNKISRRRYASQCELRSVGDELRFHCRPSGRETGAVLRGHAILRAGHVVSGALDSVALGDGEPLALLEVDPGKIRQAVSGGAIRFGVSSRGLRARLPDGNAIELIELRRNSDVAGEATVIVIEDFAPLRATVAAGGESGLFSAGEFSRQTVMTALEHALELSPQPRCCMDESGFPAVQDDSEVPAAGAAPVVPIAFEQHCAACHRTPERSPPNFLHGDPERVKAAFASCAPRIFVRLSMWSVPPGEREKTPMPPPSASHGGMPPDREYGLDPGVIDSLKAGAAQLLREETGGTPTLAGLLAYGYENLRPCLPPGS